MIELAGVFFFTLQDRIPSKRLPYFCVRLSPFGSFFRRKTISQRGGGGNRTPGRAFAELGLTTWRPRHFQESLVSRLGAWKSTSTVPCSERIHTPQRIPEIRIIQVKTLIIIEFSLLNAFGFLGFSRRGWRGFPHSGRIPAPATPPRRLKAIRCRWWKCAQELKQTLECVRARVQRFQAC